MASNNISVAALRQGAQFADMTRDFHGGRRMRGGSLAAYPGDVNAVLPNDMRMGAGIEAQDAAFEQLHTFAGKYNMDGGRRRRAHRRMKGGVADVSAPAMILTSAEEAAQAFLHPQWTNENLVVPSFKGADNALVQSAGARKSRKAARKSRKASRKSRKASRKSRKASRKSLRKASRKSRKASRKSLKSRKAARKSLKSRRASRKSRKAARKSRKARKASRK